MAEYEVYLYNAEMVLVDEISTDFAVIDYTLVTNAIHALTLTLPGEYTVDEDYRLEVYREGALVGDTQFIVIEVSASLGTNGEYMTVISGAGVLKVLDWPVVNYAPGLLQSHHADYAGNVIKQLVRQNMGSLATDTARNMTDILVVQADANDGAEVEVEVGWRRLLDAIREVAGASEENGIAIYYDVIKNSGGLLELQTFTGQRGTDRSTSVVLSPERGNLVGATLVRNFTNGTNRAIVGGTGQELWRNVVEVPNTAQVNNTPWGYIKEQMYTSEQATTVAEALRIGESFIRLNANKVTLSGTPADTPAVIYGTHYGWGDLISIEFLGYVAIVSLDRVQVKVQGGAETVQLELRGDVV